MKNSCSRTGATCTRHLTVRTRAEPATPNVSQDIAPEQSATFAVIRKLATRVAYLGFLIVVPGSLIMLAAWQWIAFRRRALASTH
jgi:hypothetical protein